MTARIVFTEPRAGAAHVAILVPEETSRMVLGLHMASLEEFEGLRMIGVNNAERRISVVGGRPEAETLAAALDEEYYSIITKVDDETWAVNSVNIAGIYDSGLPLVCDYRHDRTLNFVEGLESFVEEQYLQYDIETPVLTFDETPDFGM